MEEQQAGMQLQQSPEIKLRLGFDGKRATKNLTGLGNYSRWLIGQLANFYPGNSYLVYTPAVRSSPRIAKFLGNEQIKLRRPSNSFMWRSMNIIKDLARDGVELYHGLSHEIPFTIQYSKVKSVVTIHDLIFLKYPQYYKWLDRVIYSFKSKNACKNADKIIAISERTKADIIELFGTDPAKIEVIYQSCDDSFKLPVSDATKKTVATKYQLPENFVLYVGTIEARKNLATLIKALKNVDRKYSLVVVGQKTGYYKTVEAAMQSSGVADRVKFYNQMDFADLPSVYQLAKAFALPSYYEGFGIPLIEALYSGAPVIAATGSCLEEAAGPDSIYVHPDDPEAMANAINVVLTDEGLRTNMIARGREYVQRFNNETLTGKLMNCYLNILGK